MFGLLLSSPRAKITGIITALALLLLGTLFVIFYKENPTPPVELVAPQVKNGPAYKVIGSSAEGRKIEAYTYGYGKTHLLFVGGMHGGYEWNSILLAYEIMDYLKKNPSLIPAKLSVTVIPSANPDGQFAVLGKEGRFALSDAPKGDNSEGKGRMNAHNVDLNRNFDCKWKPGALWKNKPVGAGAAPFSEPEAQAIRDFVFEFSPSAVIFWHSKSGAVYASECENGILPATLDIMKAYALAAGYRTVRTFDTYKITGDSEGWLASINIPALTVELKTHETVELEENLAGIKAVFDYFSK